MNLGNVFILGDSYSSFDGYIPNDYGFWYPNKNEEQTDVKEVSQTWWWQLMEATGSNLVRNESWSGTTICNTCRPALDIQTSFVNRFEKLVNDGFFKQNNIDTFFIFGGTNDSWIDSPIGELIFQNWQEDDLLCVLPAISYLFYRIKTILPNARIVSIINTDLKAIIIDGVKKAAEHFGVEYLQLENISKQYGHPDIKGMSQIKDQVLSFFE